MANAATLLEVLDRDVVNAVRPVRPQRVDALVNHVEHVPLRLLVRLEVETKLVLHLSAMEHRIENGRVRDCDFADARDANIHTTNCEQQMC